MGSTYMSSSSCLAVDGSSRNATANRQAVCRAGTKTRFDPSSFAIYFARPSKTSLTIALSTSFGTTRRGSVMAARKGVKANMAYNSQ